MKSIYAAAFLYAAHAHAEVTSVSILPTAPEAAIKRYDAPHWIYVNREILVEHKEGLLQAWHELVLFIPGSHIKGTPAGGKGPAAFLKLAANLGYHVIFLHYPNDIAAARFRESNDPNAFEEFRLAVIKGGHNKYISIERSESIENRLIKLLLHLKAIRPKEHWEQFLNDDDTTKWETIAVAGQSQGGGHAALIGIKHRVARVICSGAPKDYNRKLNAPAAWYRHPSATPKACFFAFNHRQDPMGCTPEQLLKNLKTLELDGPSVDVDRQDSPYQHSRMLFTSYPQVTVTGENSEAAVTAHASMLDTKNADRWKQVWTCLLTEKTP